MTYLANVEKKDRKDKTELWPIHGDKEERGNDVPSFAGTDPEKIKEILKIHLG